MATAVNGIANLNLSGIAFSIPGSYTITVTSVGLTPAVASFTVTAGAYTITAPATPIAVVEGGAVQINVAVPPVGGAFNSVVTMSASGLPPGATATFNPPTVTPGSAGAPTVLTIQLLMVSSANLLSVPTTRGPFLSLGTTLALCFAFFFYRRSPHRIIKRLLVFASFLLVVTLLSACNGGFAAKPGTIPGNYVVTITGTSGNLHPSTTVTITVQ
jgi:hypothetical protein